jgi:hypothetical protein
MAATFFISIWLLIGKIIKLPFKIPLWLAKIFKPLREKINDIKNRKSVRQVDLGRRKFVRYAYTGLTAYSFGAATYGLVSHDSYEITKREIKIDNLPPQLKGLTITLISDIHAGSYMNESDMREYADVVNDIKSDVICIPGDFVNFQTEDVHMVNKAFRDLNAKHGIFGSLGNHDFFRMAIM